MAKKSFCYFNGYEVKDKRAREDIEELQNVTTTKEQEKATLGEELVTSTGWITDGWSGDLTTGFTHTSGNTNSLIFTMPESTGTKLYQVSFRSNVEMSTTNLKVRIGGSELFELYGQGNPINVGIKSVSDGTLEFVPESTFTGTISNISIKEITGPYSGNYKITDSNGKESFSIRSTKVDDNGLGDGYANLFVGSLSGVFNTSGYGNVGLGSNTLNSNTSGFWNCGIGFNALAANTVGSRNIALGYSSLLRNISGQRNIGIGSFSLINNTIGCHNVAIGADSLNDNISGYANVAIGSASLYKNTSGFQNIAIGRGAMGETETGESNIAIGCYSGQKTNGKNNIYMGVQSGYFNETGNYNITLGCNAGKGISGANYSKTTIIGSLSGQNLAAGSENNVFVGCSVGNGITSGKNNILIGIGVEQTENASYLLNIGNLVTGSMDTSNPHVRIQGAFEISYLPKYDPGVAGRLWNDGGTVKVSAG